ncbi:hypothetical protein ASE06_12720 [Sphingopyxis sp. Root214]|jgi:hypothetical protein|uniref:hypothetical protein n=1 Tax=unclassified Sphingopyxis TaxID=2614943 RepID=UPI0006FB3B5C|nr:MULTISPECIES: hypothetical protein [unclassified Sphingopyxis]KQZ73260.1 hypothetical protein ASD73_10370 [Sphingopyxis sp. Root154]KRC07407.1 hypothetical protein ASE06_12720 [Sphingopyxis sp. Root214]
MNLTATHLQPETEPGVASAEEGLVFLDGPDGIAKTMTPDAAQRTGQSLIEAAAEATKQKTDSDV